MKREDFAAACILLLPFLAAALFLLVDKWVGVFTLGAWFGVAMTQWGEKSRY